MRRTVTVGESLRDAARICGTENTATNLLIYADVERGELPSLAEVDVLVLGAGPGLDDLLRTACSGLGRGEPQVLEVALDGSQELRAALAADRELAVLGARPVPGGVVVRIGRAQDPENPSTRSLDVLEDLVKGRLSTAPAGVVVTQDAGSQNDSVRTSGGRRAVLALVGAGLLVVLAAVVAGMVLGADAAVLVLLGSVVAGELVTVAGVALVLRHVRALRSDERRRDRRLRTVIAKRTDRLRHRSDLIRSDLGELEVLKEYVLEIGRQQARTARAVDDLRARTAPDHADPGQH